MKLRLIVPCTKRKHLPAAELALAQLAGSGYQDSQALVAEWWSRALSASQGRTLPAGRLYRGAQWPLVQAARQHCPADLHILSAGLGLLGEHDPVPGYGATFSRGADDTVALPGMTLSQAHPHWWQLLSERRLPGQAGPRTLAELMAAHPDDGFLVVASPPYLHAIACDLQRGMQALAEPQRQLLVITSGEQRWLAPSLVLRSRAEMRGMLGGGLLTLNVRLAGHVMASFAVCGDLGRAAQTSAEALGVGADRTNG